MWVEETKNGKYKFIERYTDYLTGKSKRVSIVMDKNTSQNRKTAQSILNDKIRFILEESSSNDDITLNDLVERYRADQLVSVTKATYQRNYHACNGLKRILGENILVSRLDAGFVRSKFLETKDSPGTLNERLKRFKALLRWGYQNDLIDDIRFLDKLVNFKDKPHKEKIQDKFLEASEFRKLLDNMDNDNWRLLTAFMVLSGLRVGECIALNKDDINLKERVIHVTKTYDSNNKTIAAPKSLTSIRDVYIQDELLKVIKDLNKVMLKQRLELKYKDNQILVASRKGDRSNYFSFNEYLKDKSKKVLGKKVTTHTLRHTSASLMMESGVPIDTIQRRLGHESCKVTKEIYLHITEKLKKIDNEKIAQVVIFEGAKKGQKGAEKGQDSRTKEVQYG